MPSPSLFSLTAFRIVAAGLVAAVLYEGVHAYRHHLQGSDLPPAVEIDTLPRGSFTFTDTFTVHGAPGAVYDALTGDVTPWWDHSVSGHRKKMYIEAKPGGGFFEMMDDAGNGIRHAVVTYADRGKRLVMEGPLPFYGHPIDMLTMYELSPVHDRTQVVLTVRATGEIQPKWPARVEKTWRHFIYERFIPYWDAKERGAPPPP